MTTQRIVEVASTVVEMAGIAVIVMGAALSALWALRCAVKVGGREAYKRFRLLLGRSILIGLELLVGADIIRTVAALPTFSQVGILAAIVVIRTFLSWSLEVELEGRWPWTRAEAEDKVRGQRRGRDSSAQTQTLA